MGRHLEPSTALRRARPESRRRRRREFVRSFRATSYALEEAANEGMRIAAHIVDLDTDAVVFTGDAHVPLPLAGTGIVPLLVEVAAGFRAGELQPSTLIDRRLVEGPRGAGIWQHLDVVALTIADLAALAAATGDPLAANALLREVGHERLRNRTTQLGMPHTTLLDGFRERRGPDDAPQLAIGTAKELTTLFAALMNQQVVDAAVSAQVAEWLSRNQDLSLAASSTGLDPFGRDRDDHGLLLVNKTGRDVGVRAEAGALIGPRAGLAYTLIVSFEERTVVERLRVHELFRVLGIDLMEYVH